MVGTIAIVVGLLIVEVDIDITTVGLLMEGETGITTDIVEAGIDTIVAIEGVATDIGSTTGMVRAAPLEPDPWIGKAPAELNWATVVPTKPPTDAERRKAGYVMCEEFDKERKYFGSTRVWTLYVEGRLGTVEAEKQILDSDRMKEDNSTEERWNGREGVILYSQKYHASE
ncbi:hypothetical protein MMC30_001672 [Trapelia coarctata]|nr:hypothetical protein [Trapelia coarctata]